MRNLTQKRSSNNSIQKRAKKPNHNNSIRQKLEKRDERKKMCCFLNVPSHGRPTESHERDTENSPEQEVAAAAEKARRSNRARHYMFSIAANVKWVRLCLCAHTTTVDSHIRRRHVPHSCWCGWLPLPPPLRSCACQMEHNTRSRRNGHRELCQFSQFVRNRMDKKIEEERIWHQSNVCCSAEILFFSYFLTPGIILSAKFQRTFDSIIKFGCLFFLFCFYYTKNLNQWKKCVMIFFLLVRVKKWAKTEEKKKKRTRPTSEREWTCPTKRWKFNKILFFVPRLDSMLFGCCFSFTIRQHSHSLGSLTNAHTHARHNEIEKQRKDKRLIDVAVVLKIGRPKKRRIDKK